MPTKVFIGNVSSKATEDDLKEAFGKYGKITQHAIVRSFGFVHFENKEDAEKAIKELDDTEFKGTIIKVELSKTPHKNGNWVHRDFDRRDYGRDSRDRYYRSYDERDPYYYYYDSYSNRQRPPVPPPGRYRPYDRPYDYPYAYRDAPSSSYDRSRYYEDYYYKSGRSQYDKSAYSGDYYNYSSQPRSYPASSSSASGETRESYNAPPVSYPGVTNKHPTGTVTTTASGSD